MENNKGSRVQFNFLQLLSAVVLAFVCVFAGVIAPTFKTIALLFSHETTTGTVVGVKRTPTDIFKTGKNPPALVEFTVDNQTYQFSSFVHGGKNAKYDKGQELEVLYNPQDPNIAQINTPEELGMAPVIFIVLIFSVIGSLRKGITITK